MLSEPADSKDTMKHVLDTLYVILYEVCTSTNYLVVGDGKKFHHKAAGGGTTGTAMAVPLFWPIDFFLGLK